MKPPLTMTCTIERGTASDTSKGRELAFAAVAMDVPCYWWAVSEWAAREVEGVVSVGQEHLIVASDEDVMGGDRITLVTNHLGETVFSSGEYRIVDHVTTERTHKDCSLRMAQMVGVR